MDKYQYATIILDFKWPQSQDILECETCIQVTEYDEVGIPTNTTGDTGDKFKKRDFSHGSSYIYTFGWVEGNYPIVKMAPVFAKMGAEGWEVVEFKFGSNENSFANALLKRRIQKE